MSTTTVSTQNSTYLQVRLDAELKKNTEAVLKKLGLTLTDAVKIFFSQIVLKKSIPFSISIPDNLPVSTLDAETEKEVLKSLEDYKNGRYVTLKTDKEIKQYFAKLKK